MQGYESIRDGLRDEPSRYEHLHAAQLFKHAFALRTAVDERPECHGLAPVLFYVYAEPHCWRQIMEHQCTKGQRLGTG